MTRRSRSHQASIGWDAAQGPLVATYQTRISDYGDMVRAGGDAALSAYAELYGRVQRKLFAAVAADRSAASLKSDYIREHGIPARMFNAVRVSLEGKVSSVREQQKLRVDGLQRRIARAERQVAQAEGTGSVAAGSPEAAAAGQSEVTAGGTGGRHCGGPGAAVLRVEEVVAESGITSRPTTMRAMRNGYRTGKMLAVMRFFVLGSRDETAGCQLCVATVADDGTLTLRLRMPDCLANQHGKYLIIPHVRFAYGHEQVLAALQSNADYAQHRREHGEKAARATELGQAIGYRFKRDGKLGFTLFKPRRQANL